MTISLSLTILCKKKHLSEFGHFPLFKKLLQYLVVPKKARIIFPLKSKESTHKIA